LHHFKRNTLSLAIGAAVISLSSLPVLAATDTHSVDGVLSTAASFTNTGTIENIVVLAPMTGITNSGTIATTDSNAIGITIDTGASVGSLVNDGDITINLNGGSASVAGISVDAGIEMAGEIINTATIAISTMDPGDDHTYYGIELRDELTGSLINNGDIILSAEATDQIYIEGIHVSGIGKTGVLTNDGLIDITAVNSDDTLEATGIHIFGDMAGTVLNSGIISIYAEQQNGTSSGVSGGGIWAQGEVSGSITNSGEITATTISTVDYDNYAYGIYVSDDLTTTGSITNTSTGEITVHASNDTAGSGSYATATGIYVGGDVAGTITNDGLISVTAINTYSDVDAVGIYAGSLSGSIVNNGDININASAPESDVYRATGIYVDGDVAASGSIINTGNITVDVSGTDDYAEGAGIYVAGDMAGIVRNSKNITLTSTVNGDDKTSFYGIHLDTLSGTLTNTNTGNISVSRTVLDSSSSGLVGIDVDTLTGTLNNEGSIVVTGTGTSYSAAAYGIYVDTVEATGVLNNSGDIIVAGHSYAYAEGIRVGTLDGALINSGTISASNENNSGVGYDMALYVSSGTGTISNTGLIEGDIDIGGAVAVNNAGIISIPTGKEGEVAADYTQTAAGIFRLGTESSALYGQLDIGSTATFAPGSGIQVAVDPAHTLMDSDELADVITAASLDASTFTVGDNNLSVQFAATIDGNTVDLTAQETGLTTIAAATGWGVGGALDTFISNHLTGDIAFRLGSLSSAQEVADAAESLKPALSGGVAQMTNNTMNAVTDVVAARQDLTRGLSSGDGFMEDRHLWFKPFGNWTDQDDRDGVSGYDIDSYGLAFGVDGDVSPTWNLGFAFAYIDSDVDSDLAEGSNDIDVDSYMTKVYATKTLDDTTALNLQAGYGISDYDSKRRLFNGDVADADYDSWNFQASAELERNYQMNEKTTMTPYVHADYGYVDVDSYREKGAGDLNLDVNDDSADSLIIGTGVKTSYVASTSLLLTADAGIGYDFMTDRSSLTSAFSGGGAQFSTKGIDPDEVVYNARLGAEFNLDNGSEITVRYDIDGREDYTDQSVSVNFRFMF